MFYLHYPEISAIDQLEIAGHGEKVLSGGKEAGKVKIQEMFVWLSAFMLAVAVVYGVWSKEPAGTTALFLAFGLTIMIGFYLAFTARRVDVGAQDNKEADVADDAGEVGFFSPHKLAAARARFRCRARLPGRRPRLVADVLRGTAILLSIWAGLRVLPRRESPTQ
ncbi:cytochrome c oxidase subunit 4 [Streptomyces hirsutus]